jgi:hypothetical protein
MVSAVGIPLAFASSSQSELIPNISSISITGYPSSPTVTVTGSNFGGAPTNGTPTSKISGCTEYSGLTGDDYGESTVWLLDASRSSGLYGAAQFGADIIKKHRHSYGSCGGVIIGTGNWTATSVTFTLGTGYGDSGISLTSGDTACVEIKGTVGCTVLP